MKVWLVIIFQTIIAQVYGTGSSLQPLPKVAVPSHYNLFLKFADVPENTYDGIVEVTLHVIQETSDLYLNCKNLKLDKENVTISDDPVLEVVVDDEAETCTIKASESLKAGADYLLKIPFSGVINNKTEGVWQTYYTKDYLTSWYFMATNLFPSFARSVFPCLDAPEYKAIVELTVEHDFRLNFVSNTEIAEESQGLPRKTVFEPTSEPIPTYAFGFAAYQFNGMLSVSDENLTLIHNELKEMGKPAIKILKKIEDIFISFFDNHSQLKLDFVALPFSKPNGQTDAWGLHLVRSEDIFQNQLLSPAKLYQAALQKIAYTLGLNWLEYGPTPAEFKDFWISRGLSRYFEYNLLSNNAMTKSFVDWNQFVIHNTHKALELDESPEALPVQQIPSETNKLQLLDYRMYEKSSALFNMFKNLLGADNFETAIQEYVATYSSSTINTFNLIEILQKHLPNPLPAGIDFEAMVNSWIKTPGYPIIRVLRTDKNIILTQEPYRPGHEESASLFYIPLNFVTTQEGSSFEDTSITHWLTPDSNKIELPNENNALYILNKQQTGFYRVLYDKSSYESLTRLLYENPTAIHVLNRVQLMDDLASFTKNGLIDYSVLMDFLIYLKDEESYIGWTVANKILNRLFTVLRGSEAFDRYETFVRLITKKHFDQVGIVGNILMPHFDRLDQEVTAELACFSGVDSCVNESQRIIDDLLTGKPSIKVFPEIIPTVLCTVMRHNYSFVDLILDTIMKPVKPKNKVKTSVQTFVTEHYTKLIFEKLGCTRNETGLKLILDFSIIPGKQMRLDPRVRRQIFQSVTKGSYMGTKMGLEFIKENYLALNQRYDNLTLLFEDMNGLLVTKDLCDLLNEILSVYGAKFYPPSVKKAALKLLKTSQEGLTWTNTYVPVIAAWLAENEYNATEAPDYNKTAVLHLNFIGLLFVMTFTLFNLFQ